MIGVPEKHVSYIIQIVIYGNDSSATISCFGLYTFYLFLEINNLQKWFKQKESWWPSNTLFFSFHVALQLFCFLRMAESLPEWRPEKWEHFLNHKHNCKWNWGAEWNKLEETRNFGSCFLSQHGELALCKFHHFFLSSFQFNMTEQQICLEMWPQDIEGWCFLELCLASFAFPYSCTSISLRRARS